MAYANVLSNNEQYSSFVDPRISFSNEFGDPQHQTSTRHEQIKYKEAPVSSDFEFNVKNYGMIPADEIFFQGVLLPLREEYCGKNQRKLVTLREELISVDEDEDDCVISKGSNWWKLGLKSKKDPKKNNTLRDPQVIVSDKSQICLAKILEYDE